MTKKRAVEIRSELARIWKENRTASSDEIIAKFKRLHGNVPNFDVEDLIDCGLRELAGQVAKTPFITGDDEDLLSALQSDADRKVLRQTLLVMVRQDGRIVPIKLDTAQLTPEAFAKHDIVQDLPKTRRSPTQLEVVQRDMKKMAEAGFAGKKYGTYLREGGN